MIQELKGEGFKIAVFTTDRSRSIKKMICGNFFLSLIYEDEMYFFLDKRFTLYLTLQ